MAVFAGSTANGIISNGGLSFTRSTTTGTEYANCVTDVPVAGKQYVEARIIRASTADTGFGLYADGIALNTAESIGIQRWDTAAAYIGCGSPWSLYLRANYGGIGDLYVGGFADLPGTSPVNEVVAYAVDSITREVWVKRIGSPGWHGGGDPATGTNPTFVLQGANPIFFGASVNNQNNSVHMLPVAQQTGPTPAGFTNYLASSEPEPGSDVDGSTAFHLAAAGTARGRGVLAASATTTLAAAAAIRGRVASNGGTSLDLSVAAAVRGLGRCTGTSHLTTGTMGALSAEAALTGGAGLDLTAAGALRARGRMAATAAVAFTGYGTAVPLVPGIEGRGGFALTAALDAHGRGALAGAAGLTLASAGTARGRSQASGTAGLTFNALATATQPGLHGSAALNLQASGLTRGRGALAGSAGIGLASSATLRGRSNLTGAAGIGLVATVDTSRAAASGHVGLELAAAGVVHGRGRLAGSASLAFTASAASSSSASIAGATGLAFDASGAGVARAAVVGETAMVLATVGALLARAAGRGATALVLTPAGEIRGDATVSGSTGITFVGGIYVAGEGREPIRTLRPHDPLEAAARPDAALPPARRDVVAMLEAQRLTTPLPPARREREALIVAARP